MKNGELSVGDIVDTHLEKSDKPDEKFPIGRNPVTRKIILLDEFTPFSHECKVGMDVRVKIVRPTRNYLIGVPLRELTKEEVSQGYHAPPIVNNINVIACPFCSANQELITYFSYYNKLIRAVVVDGYCNQCKRGWLVIPTEEP